MGRGWSCAGATAADAPPTSEKVNPAAPKTGAVLLTRFRFEACFTRAMLASSIVCVTLLAIPRLHLMTLRSRNQARKLAGRRVRTLMSGFMLMNGMFITFAPSIIIAKGSA